MNNVTGGNLDNYEETHTKICYNRKTNLCCSILVQVSLFYQFGCLQGYIISLTIYLQTQGATYQQQALLSIAFFPFALKILAAPVIDSLFFKGIGKSKTYILNAGILNAVLLCFLSYRIEGMLSSLDIGRFVSCLLPITIVMTFQEVAVEAWMLTILGDQREKGGYAVWLGIGAGIWTGYPLFSVLNTKGVMLNEDYIFQLAIYIFVCTILIILFVAEEKLEVGLKNCSDYCGALKSVFGNRMFRLWISWGILKSLGIAFVFKPFDLKIIEFGFKRKWLVEIALYIIPFVLCFVGIASKLLVPGKINYYIYFGYWLQVLLIIYSGIIFVDMKNNQNFERTYIQLQIRMFSWIIFEATSILELGFINIMCDKTVGPTHLTLLGSLNNIVKNLIETLSLYLLTYISYEYYFIWGVVYMTIMLLNTKHIALTLDEAKTSEFKLKNDIEQEKNIEYGDQSNFDEEVSKDGNLSINKENIPIAPTKKSDD